MALPANDPYEVPAPTITAHSIAGTNINGTIYQWSWTGTNFCIFADMYWDYGVNQYWATQFYSIDDPNIGKLITCDGVPRAHFYFSSAVLTPPSAGVNLRLKNPVWYIRQTPADIILAIAHWHCGIVEADIDVASFIAASIWHTANGFLRSVAFVNDSVLNIIKKLGEQTAGTFIYINGINQLACGYIGKPPGTTPDWTIDADNYIRIIRFEIMEGRKIPGRVRIGYRTRHIKPATPEFGVNVHAYSGATFADREQVLDEDYDAQYCDNVWGQDIGVYEHMNDYIYCEVEVKGIGHLVDIDETVKLDEATLGMSIDPSWVDNFRIHSIDLNIEDMTAIIGMVRKITWNIV